MFVFSCYFVNIIFTGLIYSLIPGTKLNIESSLPINISTIGSAISLFITPGIENKGITKMEIWVTLDNKLVYRLGLELDTHVPPELIPEICRAHHWSVSVSECDKSEIQRKVTYSWKEPKKCVSGDDLPQSTVLDCDFVPNGSSTATVVFVVTGISVAVCFACISWVLLNWNTKIVKSSQRLFCLCILFGGIIMSLSNIAFLGENTNRLCVLRPWLLNLSFTCMFG